MHDTLFCEQSLVSFFQLNHNAPIFAPKIFLDFSATTAVNFFLLNPNAAMFVPSNSC